MYVQKQRSPTVLFLFLPPAVDLAIDVVGDLTKANILVLGAGRMSELTARHLIDKGAKTIFVSNRNLSHAQELAEKI